MTSPKIAIVGGGPAGLMAAHHLVGQGVEVDLYDAMPSLGRKFLMAGKSGLNLTHNEPYEKFITRYSCPDSNFINILHGFTPTDVQNFAHELGIDTFIGSSGRIFPTDFKAAPLLRNWIRNLKQQGLRTHVRHKWCDWTRFETPNGFITVDYDVLIVALGAKSWQKLGSDGAWQAIFEKNGFSITPFKPSNCGFDINWSPYIRGKFSGSPLKSIAIFGVKGECVINENGIEGSLIYTHSRKLRLEIEQNGHALLQIDLKPDVEEQDIINRLQKSRSAKSLTTTLKQVLKLDPLKIALLHECLDKNEINDLVKLAHTIKCLPLTLERPRPLDEAISCDGGLKWNHLDENLMLQKRPGIFACGEMLDWDAPTGGYLLTACFATGKHAALGALNYLEKRG